MTQGRNPDEIDALKILLFSERYREILSCFYHPYLDVGAVFFSSYYKEKVTDGIGIPRNRFFETVVRPLLVDADEMVIRDFELKCPEKLNDYLRSLERITSLYDKLRDLIDFLGGGGDFDSLPVSEVESLVDITKYLKASPTRKPRRRVVSPRLLRRYGNMISVEIVGSDTVTRGRKHPEEIIEIYMKPLNDDLAFENIQLVFRPRRLVQVSDVLKTWGPETEKWTGKRGTLYLEAGTNTIKLVEVAPQADPSMARRLIKKKR